MSTNVIVGVTIIVQYFRIHYHRQRSRNPSKMCRYRTRCPDNYGKQIDRYRNDLQLKKKKKEKEQSSPNVPSNSLSNDQGNDRLGHV